VGSKEKWLDWLWFLVCALGSSAWCISASAQLSATFDEPFYVQAGLEHWHTGSYAPLLKLGTMPLPVDAVTLPLYIWERTHDIRFDAVNDLSRLLPWARAGTLVFWWLLLFYARLAARQLAGPWAGRLAVACLACEPSFLAHAALATTDISISACLLAFVYHFRMGRDGGWWWRVGVPTLWFGAAMLAKASALAFAPLCMLALEVERILGADPVDESNVMVRIWRGVRWRELTTITAGGLVLTFLYCGCDWQPEESFVKWAHELPAGFAHTCMSWLADHLCIFSNAGVGIVRQIKHNAQGHGAFLLGREYDRAIWFYFPVVMAIKISPPVLLAPLALLVFRPRSLLNWACLAAGALAAFSIACRVQIGIRFMLPLVALAIIGISGGLVEALQAEVPLWRRRLLGASAVAGIAWTLCSTVAVWPDGLCYVNELWGGTAPGYRKVSEANYDWGQGLKELAHWQKEHPVPLAVWYYGTDPSVKSLPATSVELHMLKHAEPDDVMQQVRGRYLAVSTTFLYGPLRTCGSVTPVREFLRGCRPVARTTTFLIYDFTKVRHDPSAINRVVESENPLVSKLLHAQPGDTELFRNDLKKLAKEMEWENQLPEDISTDFPFQWDEVEAAPALFGQDNLIVIHLKGQDLQIPGRASQILLLLDRKGGYMDQIVCTISNRLTTMDGSNFCAFGHEEPLPDGARIVVRLDGPSMRGIGHCIKHDGVETEFYWGNDDLPDGEPTKWNIRGLMRLTVKDRRFQVLFPTGKDNTERPR
jgi:hypothetical protein